MVKRREEKRKPRVLALHGAPSNSNIMLLVRDRASVIYTNVRQDGLPLRSEEVPDSPAAEAGW